MRQLPAICVRRLDVHHHRRRLDVHHRHRCYVQPEVRWHEVLRRRRSREALKRGMRWDALHQHWIHDWQPWYEKHSRGRCRQSELVFPRVLPRPRVHSCCDWPWPRRRRGSFRRLH